MIVYFYALIILIKLDSYIFCPEVPSILVMPLVLYGNCCSLYFCIHMSCSLYVNSSDNGLMVRLGIFANKLYNYIYCSTLISLSPCYSKNQRDIPSILLNKKNVNLIILRKRVKTKLM